MNFNQSFGYRPYDPDPVTATGIAAPEPMTTGMGYAALVAVVAGRLAMRPPTKRNRRLVGLDLYQAPEMDVFLERFRAAWEEAYGAATWIDTRIALKDSGVLAQELQEFLTADPVFGRVCDRDMRMFFDLERWQALLAQVNLALRSPARGFVFVVGPGALLSPLRLYTDVALFAEVPRETVFFASEASTGRNLGDERNRGKWPRYKRSYYVDWPVQNRHMVQVLPACDFLIDMHDAARPTFVDTRLLFEGLEFAAHRPFRVRPVFMPGVWGGQRLKGLVPGLPTEWPNCAWGFEVVAPENSLALDFAGTQVRVAFELFLHFQATKILGLDNHRRFGEFFPIRFDYLDTMGGGNLSCQVHPPDAYISSHFREPFAQHEMYYVFEMQPGAKVYLGLQESTSREAFEADVARAESEGLPFEITKHVNAWPTTRGDLFLIPAGTVHCSGAGNLVLEISATPYIYTFKIYDYLRPDLDGAPRPISSKRAFEVIDFTRKTRWVREKLLASPRCRAQGNGWRRLLLTESDLLFLAVE